jgi:hypothetical protein
MYKDSHNFSSKSFSTAVSLAGIFGIIGIHHFYIGNILHGLFDLSLLIFGVYFLSQDNFIGAILLLADVIHTIIVFYNLVTEQQKDAHGKLIVMEDTKKKQQM